MRVFKIILRTAVALAAAAMTVWFTAPMTLRVINIGNIVGGAVCLWVLLFCITPLHHAIRRAASRFAVTRFFYRFINIAVIVFLCYGAVCTAAMVTACMAQPESNATAVVLGAKVNGTEPSLILLRRIEAAEAYLRENPMARAVLSGGKGEDEGISEAECMYNALVERGILPGRLYIEDNSTNTSENIRFSRKVIDDNRLNQNVAVITDGFHQLRARLIVRRQNAFRELGAVNAKTDWLFLPTYAVREWFALPTLLAA